MDFARLYRSETQERDTGVRHRSKLLFPDRIAPIVHSRTGAKQTKKESKNNLLNKTRMFLF